MSMEQHGEFSISTDRALLDINMIHRFLAFESYWAREIDKDRVLRAVESSLCFGVFRGWKQIGFARVVTDRATFAYLCDVFILEPFRGQGLGRWLMESIHSHPDLQGLRRWLLATRDAHGLYAKSGWKSLESPERFMERVAAPV